MGIQTIVSAGTINAVPRLAALRTAASGDKGGTHLICPQEFPAQQPLCGRGVRRIRFPRLDRTEPGTAVSVHRQRGRRSAWQH
jgi:hypothetical protein